MDAEIKDPSAENPNLKGFPFNARVGGHITVHASTSARNFFLANFYPLGPFTCIFFPKPPSSFFFFPVLAVANTGFCVDPQEIGHPGQHYRQSMQVPVLSVCGI